MTLRSHIGGHDVLLECSERLKEEGYAVLRKLAELNLQGPAIQDSTKIQFGWSVLTLRLDGPSLRVYEPDYLGDALHALNCNLDLTLDVVAEQVSVLRRENANGVDVRFDQYVIAGPEALGAATIFMSRQHSPLPNDTGWFIGDLARIDRNTEADLKAWRVFELLKLKRSAMKLLALPPGYAVVMTDDEINSIMRS